MHCDDTKVKMILLAIRAKNRKGQLYLSLDEVFTNMNLRGNGGHCIGDQIYGDVLIDGVLMTIRVDLAFEHAKIELNHTIKSVGYIKDKKLNYGPVTLFAIPTKPEKASRAGTAGITIFIEDKAVGYRSNRNGLEMDADDLLSSYIKYSPPKFKYIKY